MKPPIVLLQERDFGQKINATFEFVVQHFKPLLLALVYIAGPPALIGGFFMGSYQSNILGIQRSVRGGTGDAYDAFAGIYALGGSALFLVAFVGLASLAATLVVNAYMLEYEEGNQNITPEVVWNRLKNYIGKSIGYSLVMFMLVVAATLLFIIPGIYVGVALSLMYIVMMRENLDLSATFRRCFYLIQDKWWSTFGLLFIMGLISGIMGYVFQIPNLIITFMTIFQLGDGVNDFWTTLSGIVSTVGSVLVRSLVLVAITFQYYNLVERREGSAIINAIDDIGNADSPRPERPEEEL